MKIGELAQRTGVSVRMLRYYEAEGLLAPPRLPSGYRAYGAAELEVVERIKLLGAAGMTLPVIRAFLPCALDARAEFEPCDELVALLEQQATVVDEKIRQLEQSRRLLRRLRAGIDTRLPVRA